MKPDIDEVNWAIHDGNISLVKKLIEFIDVNSESSLFETPLLRACEEDCVEIVTMLIECGADVNLKSRHGFTALHMAVDASIDGTIQENQPLGSEPTEIIETLLKYGADPTIQNNKGESAIDLARQYRSAKVLELLKRYQITE